MLESIAGVGLLLDCNRESRLVSMTDKGSATAVAEPLETQ